MCHYRATLFDTSDLLCDAADSLIDDSFFRCFTSAPPDPWNWNWYLFPTWVLGTFLRYFIIFPLRALMLATCMMMFFAAFFPLQLVLNVRTLQDDQVHPVSSPLALVVEYLCDGSDMHTLSWPRASQSGWVCVHRETCKVYTCKCAPTGATLLAYAYMDVFETEHLVAPRVHRWFVISGSTYSCSSAQRLSGTARLVYVEYAHMSSTGFEAVAA